jgi:hypothetical protein
MYVGVIVASGPSQIFWYNYRKCDFWSSMLREIVGFWISKKGIWILAFISMLLNVFKYGPSEWIITLLVVVPSLPLVPKDLRRSVTVLVLTLVGTVAVYVLLRAFLYVNIYRCTLWLTPLDNGTVRVPTWVFRMNEGNIPIYDVPYDIRHAGPELNDDYSKGLWSIAEIPSAYRYLHLVTLAAERYTVYRDIPFSKDTLYVGASFRNGTLDPVTYFIPFVVSYPISLLIYFILFPAISRRGDTYDP